MVLSGALTTALYAEERARLLFANAARSRIILYGIKTFGDNMVVQRNEQFAYGERPTALSTDILFLWNLWTRRQKGVISNGEWCVEYPKSLLKENTVGQRYGRYLRN